MAVTQSFGGCYNVSQFVRLTQTGYNTRRPYLLVIARAPLGHRRKETGNNNGEDTRLKIYTGDVHIAYTFSQRTLSTHRYRPPTHLI